MKIKRVSNLSVRLQNNNTNNANYTSGLLQAVWLLVWLIVALLIILDLRTREDSCQDVTCKQNATRVYVEASCQHPMHLIDNPRAWLFRLCLQFVCLVCTAWCVSYTLHMNMTPITVEWAGSGCLVTSTCFPGDILDRADTCFLCAAQQLQTFLLPLCKSSISNVSSIISFEEIRVFAGHGQRELTLNQRLMVAPYWLCCKNHLHFVSWDKFDTLRQRLLTNKLTVQSHDLLCAWQTFKASNLANLSSKKFVLCLANFQLGKPVVKKKIVLFLANKQEQPTHLTSRDNVHKTSVVEHSYGFWRKSHKQGHRPTVG